MLLSYQVIVLHIHELLAEYWLLDVTPQIFKDFVLKDNEVSRLRPGFYISAYFLLYTCFSFFLSINNPSVIQLD